jgi:hypothetical protein
MVGWLGWLGWFEKRIIKGYSYIQVSKVPIPYKTRMVGDGWDGFIYN